MSEMVPRISVVVPVYNEAENIIPFYEALCHTWSNIADRYAFDLILVNDGSDDNSRAIICELAATDHRVKYLEFTRNFGKEIAISAGLHHAGGVATITIDADLQHPVHRIPEFISKWENGAEVVIGIRRKSKDEGLVRKGGSLVFNWLLSRLSETDMPLNSTDFRILDAIVVTAFKQFPERNRITRGLIDWMGFRYETIPFDAAKRTNGRPRYTLSKLAVLMLNSLTSMSLMPIRLAGYLGIGITFLSTTLGILVIIEQYILGDPMNLYLTGAVQLAIFNMFLIGIVLICLGAMSIYIAHTYTEVINRPMYLLRDKVNFDD